MFIEINISTCVFLPRSGGGLRTGASCSWDLEKICNWFAVKGPVRSSSAKLRFVSTKVLIFSHGQSRSVYLPGWKQNEEKVAYLCLII